MAFPSDELKSAAQGELRISCWFAASSHVDGFSVELSCLFLAFFLRQRESDIEKKIKKIGNLFVFEKCRQLMALLACCISLELFFYYSNMIWRIFSSSDEMNDRTDESFYSSCDHSGHFILMSAIWWRLVSFLYFSCQCVGKELFFCFKLQIPDKSDPSPGRQGPDLVFSF